MHLKIYNIYNNPKIFTKYKDNYIFLFFHSLNFTNNLKCKYLIKKIRILY